MMSFAAIRQEALREKQLEEEARARRRIEDEEAELARVLALSAAQQDGDVFDEYDDDTSINNTNTATNGDDEDASLALAMQLQAQFEHEDAMRRRADADKLKSVYRDPLSKVQVVAQPQRLPQRVVKDAAPPQQQQQQRFYEDDEGSFSDEEYDDEDEENDRYAVRLLADAQRAQPQLSFNMSRHIGAIGNETKHGHAVTSERNVRSIGDSVLRAGDMSDVKSGLSNIVKNQLNRSVRRAESRRVRRSNREDTATVDHVLDKQTRLMILNLMNAGTLTEMHGTIATGKESNVYHATGRNVTQFGDAAPLEELAVKIFAVSATVFKDRQKYMHGERRFQRGNLSAAATRKFIRVWAEKEMRNLCRLRRTGMRCPTPLALRDHVLVMSFVGRDGAAAPKLKDVQLPPAKWSKLYKQTLVLMRRMFHDCKLVHSDLSAYNILYDEGELVVIDLSHAISADIENASQFLRDDVLHVTRFFADHGAKTLAPRLAFRFIVQSEPADGAAPLAAESDTDEQASIAAPSSDADAAIEAATTDDDDADAASLVSVDVPAPPSDDASLAALRERCALRAERAALRLAALVKRAGETGRFADRNWTVRDEAFLHEHLPRSLQTIADETMYSADDLATFDLLAEADPKQFADEQDE
jgi:serine/threonine-protein kinase RIO1